MTVLLGLALLSYTWAIQRGTLTGYYVGVVRSMSLSWRAFFFGSVDPAGWLTVDKLPGAFWIQALAVRAFGLSVWTVIGPQAVEGLLSIYVAYRAVRGYAGAAAGLGAGVVILVMPVSTALSRGNVPDALSTLLLVLAASAALKSLADAGVRSMVVAGVWVGLAFQAKMIQAWLLLPVIALVYLLAAAPNFARRLRNTAVMLGCAVAVSLSWMLVVSWVPAAHRPWFDGSRSNSVFEQVFVYNGLSRLTGDPVLGLHANAVASLGSSHNREVPLQVSGINTAPSWERMFYGGFALGVSWLIPLALASAVLLLWLRRRAPRTDLLRAATLFWLLFLGGNLVVFSVLQHFNSYYSAVLVPAIAALIGTGAVTAWTSSRAWVRGWGVSFGLALSLLYGVLLLHIAGQHWAWLEATALILGAVAVVLSAVRPLRPRSRFVSGAAAAVAVASLLLIPACGSLALDTHQGGPYTFAFSQRGIGPLAQPSAPGLQERYRRPVAKLLAYLEPRTRGMRYLLATGGSVPAATLIAATGRAVIPMGGYSGQMPTPTVAQLQQLIAQGQLRFFLIDPRSHGLRQRWIVGHCQLIPGFPTTSEISQTKAQLFDCTP